MTATTARTSTRTTPMLFSRQRQLLQLLDALGGTSGMLDFQKLLFLYCQEASTGEAPYDFVPYKFGAFSFTSYADRRKLIERGLLEDEDGWQITAEGRKIIGRTMDMQLAAFAKRHRGLHGDALVADTYRRFPFFATRSEIAERVLKGDDAALARIKAVRAKATGPALSTIGYEGHTLESYLTILLKSGVTLLAAAIIDLFRRGYIEPAAPSAWSPHVLAHQAIALAMQEQGSATHGWWTWLEGCAAFRKVSPPERESIVRHMVDNDILVEADARLALGARGEKLYGAKNFLELYAVFSTPRVLRVMHGQSEVGVVDASFLQDKEQKVPNFVLAGRPWRIVGVDWKGGTCSVEPAEVGGYPRWFGLPVSLERSLCQAMRRVLASKDTDPSWSKRAVTQLDLQRESHAFLEDSSLPLEEDPDGRCRWWTFGGGAGNRVLAGLLELELGERVSPSNTFITFSNGAAESAVGIRQAIDALATRPLTWDDAARLVDPGQRSRVSKFQPCLPPDIEHGLIARETMSVEDANATLAQWKQGGTSREADV
jgi:hypothetical protein